jgi:peptide deformylase
MDFKIVKIGNPLLRKKAPLLSRADIKAREFQLFLRAMVPAMRKAQGVGLAANQLGSPLRAFVMECRGNKRYPKVDSFPLQSYVNARILKYSGKWVKDWEGCLSIPGFRGIVPRAGEVTFEALLSNGRSVRRTARGFEARVIQHEVDHLNGFFYMDRMTNLKSWMHLEEFNLHFKRGIRDNK